MKIVIGSDHRGYPYHEQLCQHIHNVNFWSNKTTGHWLVRAGVKRADIEAADYPMASQELVAEMTSQSRGILICGSGFGVAIAANRFAGIRAVTCRSVKDAVAARLHNDANVVCIGADFTDYNVTCQILKAFMETKFDGGDRHLRRVNMIDDLAQ